MPQTYILQGFTQYVIIDKVLYKKAKVCRHKLNKFQYRDQREIKVCKKDGVDGYFLEKQHKIKFYSLISLRHKLKKVNDADKQ